MTIHLAAHIAPGEYTLRQPDAGGPEVGQLVVIGNFQHWFLYTEVDEAVNLGAGPADTRAKYDRPTSASAAPVSLFFDYQAPAPATLDVSSKREGFDSRIEVQYIEGKVVSEATHPPPTGQVDPWKYRLFQDEILVGYVEVEEGAELGQTIERWTLSTAPSTAGDKIYVVPSVGGGAYALLPTLGYRDIVTLPARSTVTIVVECTTS